MPRRRPRSILGRLAHHVVVVVGAVSLTLLFFLVLPLIQTINRPASADTLLRTVEVAHLAPPPPVIPDEPEEPEPPEEEEPPELEEVPQQLELAMLELALDPGFGGGALEGDFALDLKGATTASKNLDALFSLADLDQRPNPVYQSPPTITAKMRKRTPGKVFVIFVVNERGRVENPIIQSSTDPVFERPVLDAIRKWTFEPGRRGGKPVKFRMRQPFTF